MVLTEPELARGRGLGRGPPLHLPSEPSWEKEPQRGRCAGTCRPQGLETSFSDTAILLETRTPQSCQSSDLQNHGLELILKLQLWPLVVVKNLSPHLQLKCYLGWSVLQLSLPYIKSHQRLCV